MENREIQAEMMDLNEEYTKQCIPAAAQFAFIEITRALTVLPTYVMHKFDFDLHGRPADVKHDLSRHSQPSLV